MTVSELKLPKVSYVACYGKATLASDSIEYRETLRLVRAIMDMGFGVVHGGYAGGLMEAAARAASRYVEDFELDPRYCIGVLNEEFDKSGCARAHSTSQTKPLANQFVRLMNIVGEADVVFVMPVGGDGTDAEVSLRFHLNSLSPYSPDLKIVPMIFFQTKQGTPWRGLIEAKLWALTTQYPSIEEIPWLHFVETEGDLRAVLKLYGGTVRAM